MGKLKRLRQENNQYDGYLTGAYKDKYVDVLFKIRGTQLNEYHQEQIRRDIIDLIWSAQKREDDILTVIPENTSSFVNAITENVPKQTRLEKMIVHKSLFMAPTPILMFFFVLIHLRQNPNIHEDIHFNWLTLFYMCVVLPYVVIKLVDYILRNDWSKKVLFYLMSFSVMSYLPIFMIQHVVNAQFLNVNAPVWLFGVMIILLIVVNMLLHGYMEKHIYTEL